jgi:hypothetical protein
VLAAKKYDATNLFVIVIKQIARFQHLPFMLAAMINAGDCNDSSAND